MTEKVIGIDPGKSGAIVLLGNQVFEFKVMPLCDGSNDIDFFKVYRFLKKHKDAHVYLERAVAFGMGVTGAFNYGRGFSVLECAITAAKNPVTYVSPMVWAKAMHKGVSNKLKAKDKSLVAAQRLFKKEMTKVPRTPKSKKPHDGVIDALLIAGYGLRK